MQKTKILLLLTVIGLMASCEKPQTEKTPLGILCSKTWRYADPKEDKNPVYYVDCGYAMLSDCNKDDRFKFHSNGKLNMYYGEENCYFFEKEIMDYSYDIENKMLIIDNYQFRVLELSEQQIKFVIKVPSPPYQYDGLMIILQ